MVDRPKLDQMLANLDRYGGVRFPRDNADSFGVLQEEAVLRFAQRSEP